jgi:hypothetical protein
MDYNYDWEHRIFRHPSRHLLTGNLRDINLDYTNFPTSRRRLEQERDVDTCMKKLLVKKLNSLESHDNVLMKTYVRKGPE